MFGDVEPMPQTDKDALRDAADLAARGAGTPERGTLAAHAPRHGRRKCARAGEHAGVARLPEFPCADVATATLRAVRVHGVVRERRGERHAKGWSARPPVEQ